MNETKVSDADLNIFIAAAREKTNLKLEYVVGQRYARIFTHRSVFCFVDLTNGNVLRHDGWRRPNLKVRNSIQGNIYDEQKGTSAMRASGVTRFVPA
jgi:hypothetical protein